MKFLSLTAGGFVLLAGCFAVPADFGSVQIATAGKDYSFTISTAQPWTDTGVDLQPGDVLQIRLPVQAENCDPAGVSGAASDGTARGLCPGRSLDRQAAGAGRAGPGRQRPSN